MNRRPIRFDKGWWPAIAIAGFGVVSVTPLLIFQALDALDRRKCRFANDTHLPRHPED